MSRNIQLEVVDFVSLEDTAKKSMRKAGIKRANADNFYRNYANVSPSLKHNAIKSYNKKNNTTQDVYGYVSVTVQNKLLKGLAILGDEREYSLYSLYNYDPDDDDDILANERREHLCACRELLYPPEILNDIRNAKTVIEMDNILAFARRNAN